MSHRHGLGQIAIGIVAFTLQGGYLIRAVLESLVLQTHGDGAGVGLVDLVGLAIVPAGNLDVLLRLLVLDEVNAAFSEHGVEFLNHHAPLGVVAGSGQVGLSHEVERAVGGMSRQIVGCSRNNPVDVGAHISLQRGVGVVRVEIFLHFAHGPIPGSLVGRAVFLEFGLYFGGHFGHGGQGIDLVGGAGRLHAHVGIAFVLVDILVGQSQVGFVQTRAGRVLIVGDEGMGQAHGLFHVVIHLDAVALERRHLVAAVGHLLAHAHVDFRGVVHRLVGLGVVLADNVHELARTFIIYKVCAAGGSLAGRRGHLQRPQAFVARGGSGIVERTVALGRQVIGVVRFNLIDIGFQQSLQRGTAAAALKVFNGFALGPRPHAVGHTVILGLLLHFLGNGGNHGHSPEVVAHGLQTHVSIVVHILVNQALGLGHLFRRERIFALVGQHTLHVSLGQRHGLLHVVIHFDAVTLQRSHLVSAVIQLFTNTHVNLRGLVLCKIRLGIVAVGHLHVLLRAYILNVVRARYRYGCTHTHRDAKKHQQSVKFFHFDVSLNI